MDAYDIFKQLTRGAKFTKKKSLPLLKKESDINDEDKSNILKDENVGSDNECQNEFEAKLFDSDDNNDNDEPPKKKIKKVHKEKNHEKHLLNEMISTLRKENRITVQGSNIPPPITTFEELHTSYNVSHQLIKNLASCNYPNPTPIQMQSIPIMLQGRPLMACAPTGSGKTIAFLTPIINDLRAPQNIGFRAIVLAPTRELAQQLYKECVRLSVNTGIKVHIISKVKKLNQTYSDLGSKKYDVLISTPNRVRYLLQQVPPLIDLKSIEWVVIDEADRLMEEGQNSFKEQVDDIISACVSTKKKIALFSATYTVPVAKWALKNFKNLARVTVGQQNSATDTVEQELLFVGSESGKLLAIRELVLAGLKPPVLIFVQSKDRAKQLFQELLYDGINVDVIHSDRNQQQRDNCVRAFREGNIWVLICTELMGRGIDFKGVNLVINYDFPPTTISYIHRIGRTGRAGRSGKAITFFTQNDTPNLRSIAQIITNSGGKVPDFMLNMKKFRKTEKKKLANIAPKRDDISTSLRSRNDNKHKLNKNQPITESNKNEENMVAKNLKKTTNIKQSFKTTENGKQKPMGKVKTKKIKT